MQGRLLLYVPDSWQLPAVQAYRRQKSDSVPWLLTQSYGSWTHSPLGSHESWAQTVPVVSRVHVWDSLLFAPLHVPEPHVYVVTARDCDPVLPQTPAALKSHAPQPP